MKIDKLKVLVLPEGPRRQPHRDLFLPNSGPTALVSVTDAKRERDNDDEIDPAAQSQSSKTRSKVGSTHNVMHSYSEEDDVEAAMQDLLHEIHKHNKVMMQVLEVRIELGIAKDAVERAEKY